MYKLVFPILLACVLFVSCSSVKPILRTAADIAKALCASHHSELQGLSMEDAQDKFCATEEQLRPWINLVLQTKRDGVTPEGQIKSSDAGAD